MLHASTRTMFAVLVTRSAVAFGTAPAGLAGRLRRPALVRRLATVAAPALSPVVSKEPAQHPAFELVAVEMVDEYATKCAMYKHTKSGAEVMSAQADDDNKVFGIVFRTPPKDDTGVPHVLEHSVLCGSRKYTSKEPFAELLKGSLQTFLNAFTYPDRTCYPVASQNTNDFYNLVNVYLDAVLHPRALTDKQVLQQEGWHYELEDKDSPLTYKGVVYNEMKGVYSSPDSLMYRAAQQAVFPDNTYGVDSGGDPKSIRTLSFEDFTSFHGDFYHPANSKIFFYGDDDTTKRLELLDEYLSDFDAPAVPADSVVATQKMKTKPWRTVEKYPASAEDGADGAAADSGKHMVLVSWLLNEDPFSEVDELALGVLDHLLMGTTASTLYKTMIESGLGDSIMGGGLSDELKQATFSIGLKGVKEADVDKVENLALDTLAKAAKDGFDADAIEASMNTIEFAMREFNTGGFPKGLSFMLAVMPRWLYDREGQAPAGALRFEEPLAKLKARLASGEKVFENLLTELVVKNGHRATVELRPDSEVEAASKKEEEDELAAAKAAMDDAAVQRVIDETVALKTAQLAEDSPEQLATIPAVGLADLERDVKTVPSVAVALAGGKATLLEHPLPTAGIVYADVALNLEKLAEADLPLIPLFTRLLQETGAGDLDNVALQRAIGARTGGISAAIFSHLRAGKDSRASDPRDIVYKLVMRGKGTGEKATELFDLMTMMLTDANLDSQAKAVEMLKESKSRLEASFVTSGNSYAGSRLASKTSLLGYVGEATSGFTYYESVKDLLAECESDWPSVLARLSAMRAAVLSKEEMVVNLTADPLLLEELRPTVEAFVDGFADAPPAAAAAPWVDTAALAAPKNEAFSMTTQVNYVASVTPLVDEGDAINGQLSVVARFLNRGYLWDNVRVVGGAYGGGCSLNPFTGNLLFSSYRDPNLQGTLDTYGDTVKHLDELELTPEALEQAIVGAVGDLDAPQTADAKGYNALRWHLTGMTTEARQQWRDETIATTAQDFANFADQLRGKPASVCVFGSQDSIDAATTQMDVTTLP